MESAVSAGEEPDVRPRRKSRAIAIFCLAIAAVVFMADALMRQASFRQTFLTSAQPFNCSTMAVSVEAIGASENASRSAWTSASGTSNAPIRAPADIACSPSLWRCVDECCSPGARDRSCHWQNLYFFQNEFWALVLNGSRHLDAAEVTVMTGVRSPTLGGVEIWKSIHPRWSPRVRIFQNQSHLDAFCKTPTPDATNPGSAHALPCPNKLLVMNGTSLWLSRGAGFNIGHALLDELFSVYMSCLKLGICGELTHSVTPTLRPVIVPGSLQMDLGLRPESVIARFCAHPVVSSKHFDSSALYQFESMIVGHGHMGMSSIDRNYCSPGQRSRGYGVDALKSFRNRMYAAYQVAAPTVVPAWRPSVHVAENAAPPSAIHNSTASPPSKPEVFSPTAWQRQLRVLVIANKRPFYPDLRQATQLMQTAGLDARLVKFPMPFQRQLEMLREADIVFSGVGTSLLAAVFLSDGATVVNLGTSEKSCAWSYMEEFLLCGTDWVRTVYNRVPNFPVRHVFALFEEAAANYRTGPGHDRPRHFALPVPIEQSLSPIGRAVREYFQRDIRMWLALVGDSMPGGGEACLGWGERFLCSPLQFEAHGCIPSGAVNMTVVTALLEKHGIQCQCEPV